MPNITEKWWFRTFLALSLFFLCQEFLSFARWQAFDDQKITLEAQVNSLERRKELLRENVFTKERDLDNLNRRLQETEISMKDRVKLLKDIPKSEPMIFFVTPTHFRPAQKADLVRLSHTLSHVPNLHWIVVEDCDHLSESVADILKSSKIVHTHIYAKTAPEKKMKYSDPSWFLPRGVEQRNAALAWIRNQLSFVKNGIIYFGDDDNTYSLSLFDEMRSVKKCGIWPVGIVGGLIVETPILAENGSVIGFNSAWKPERPFPIDMAAFAVHISLFLQNPNAGFSYDVPRGYQESQLLTSLGVIPSALEPKAQNCTKVFVWHTRTEKSKFESEILKRIKNFSISQFTKLEADSLGL